MPWDSRDSPAGAWWRDEFSAEEATASPAYSAQPSNIQPQPQSQPFDTAPGGEAPIATFVGTRHISFGPLDPMANHRHQAWLTDPAFQHGLSCPNPSLSHLTLPLEGRLLLPPSRKPHLLVLNLRAPNG
jgi:hypothetical protein